MHKDKYGRSFMDGHEDGPRDLLCLRCGKVPFRQGNPYGAYIFTFSRADRPDDMSGFAMCDPCSIAMWEWMNPEILKQAAYTAAKDQHYASTHTYIEHWNEHAGPKEQRTWGDG